MQTLSPVLQRLGFGSREALQNALAKVTIKPESSGPSAHSAKELHGTKESDTKESSTKRPTQGGKGTTAIPVNPEKKVQKPEVEALPPSLPKLPAIQHDFRLGDTVTLKLHESAAFSLNFQHTTAALVTPANYRGEIVAAPNESLWVQIEHGDRRYTRRLDGIVINPRMFALQKVEANFS